VSNYDMSTVPLLKPREVAQRQRISLSVVRRALRAGLLHGHKVGSRGDWRIALPDEQDWVRRGAPSVKKAETET
jgi:hypothetical protein